MSEKLEIHKVVSDTASLLNSAKLEKFSTSLFGLGKELSIIMLAIKAIGDNTEIRNNFIGMLGIRAVIEYAEFVMRKIAEDEVLSRLVHDRICDETKVYSNFDPESRGHYSCDFVEDIKMTAAQLTALCKTLYKPRQAAGEATLGTLRAVPETERFANVIRDLAELKAKLQRPAEKIRP